MGNNVLPIFFVFSVTFRIHNRIKKKKVNETTKNYQTSY